jgi:hypothetical protein
MKKVRILEVFIFLFGLYLFFEGLGSIVFQWYQNEPFYWHVGRTGRMFIGVVLMVMVVIYDLKKVR